MLGYTAHADTYLVIPGPAAGYTPPSTATVSEAGAAVGTAQFATPATHKNAVKWSQASPGGALASGIYTDTFGIAIGDSGVTGGYGVSGVTTLPLRWDAAGVLTPLATLAPRTSDGAIDSRVNAVGADGTAIGYSQIYDETNTLQGIRALVWAPDGTAATTLPLASNNGAFGSAQARAISPAGLIAGDGQVYSSGGTALGVRGIRWSADRTTATTLEAINLKPDGTGTAEVKGVNDAGIVIGNSKKYNGATDLGLRAVRWDVGSSTPTELGILGTTAAGVNADTTVIAIDHFGNIAGLSQKYVGGVAKGTRPVVWKAGTTTPIELPISGLDTSGAARGNMSAMNNAGFIAGTMGTFDGAGATIGRRAFVWGVNGEAYNLNDLIPAGSGWILTVATDISDSGWVSGYGTFDPEGTDPAYDRYWSVYAPHFALPQIRVAVAGSGVTDGGTIPFGGAKIGFTTVEKTFTIHNDSGSPLKITSVAATSGDTAEFVVNTSGMAASVPAGSSTTFSVTFNPTTVGSKNLGLQIISNDVEETTFDIALTATGVTPKPDILVEVGGTNLTDGASTVSYGNAVTGFTTVQKTFTIRNESGPALNISSVTATSGDTADFAVDTSGLASTLTAGASTTFTVTFNPANTGTKNIGLHIISNDVEEGTFDVTLTGTGVDSAVLAFQSAEVSVNEKAVTINVPITRVAGTEGAVSVKVNSTVGTASQNDFVAVNNAVVSFADGDSATKFVTVTILNDALVEQDETFTLTLSDVEGSAVLGAQLTTTVRISATDLVNPTLAITAPTAKQVINHTEGGTVAITGTAGDDKQVAKVQVSLNAGSYVDATLTSSGAGAGVTWTLNVTPVGGTNSFTVRALDPDGNATLLTRSFYYKKLATVTVTILGDGSVKGQPAGGIYEVGKTYTLTAVPAANKAFDGWTGVGLTAPSNEVAKLRFVFTDALFATPQITATFVTKPFIATEIGSFDGLVTPDADTDLTNQTQGFLNLTLTSAGTFSGKLKLDGLGLAVGGLFTNSGDARFGPTRTTTLLVERTGKPSLEVTQVRWDSANNTISGVIKQYLRRTVIAQSEFVLHRAAFSKAVPVTPDTYTTNGGKYTVIISSEAQSNGLVAADYPQGTGIGLITITPAGNVSLSGTLADNTGITVSVPLNSALRAPLFAQLYSAKGSYSALVALDSSKADSDLKAVDTVWFRPFQTKVHYYPWGWEEGLTLDLLGAKYTAGNNAIAGLAAASPAGNATLVFSSGKLPTPLSNDLNISSANAAAPIAAASSTAYTLTIAGATGDIKGSFTHTNGSKPTFKGKVYQKGPGAGAYGFFLTVQPKKIDGTGESGNVSLFKKVVTD